jgi:hypothetical protein
MIYEFFSFRTRSDQSAIYITLVGCMKVGRTEEKRARSPALLELGSWAESMHSFKAPG